MAALLHRYTHCTGYQFVNASFFKLCPYVYKSPNGHAPQYFRLKVKSRPPQGSVTRSASDNTLLVVPPTKTQNGDKAFAVAGPSIWNTFPRHIRDSPSTDSFKNVSLPISEIFFLLCIYFCCYHVVMLRCDHVFGINVLWILFTMLCYVKHKIISPIFSVFFFFFYLPFRRISNHSDITQFFLVFIQVKFWIEGTTTYT